MQIDPNDGTPIFETEDAAEVVIESPDVSAEHREAAEVALAAMREGWDAAGLEACDVLHEGQADNCHVDDGERRIWLSRTGTADGEPFENTVTVELNRGGSWVTVAKYDGGEGLDDEDEAKGWSAELDWERFSLSISLGNAAMQDRDVVAAALREAADSMQAGVDDEGAILDENGNKVGSWQFADDPRHFDGDVYAYRAVLEVSAENGDAADEAAREVCQLVNEPVLFGVDVHVGGDIAPPTLKLPSIHGHQAGDLA